MPEVAEPVLEKKPENQGATVDVLDRLAEKSEKKIKANPKPEQKQEPAAAAPATVKEAVALVDDGKKGAVDPTEAEKAQQVIAENQKNIEAEKVELEKKKTEKKIEGLENQVENKAIAPNHWEAEEEVSAQSGDDKKKESIKEDALKHVENKAKQYDEVVADPFVAAYLSAKKTGKDVTSFINDVQGVDPSKLSSEQLYELDVRAELQGTGLNAEQLEEKVQDELKSFSSQSDFAKIKQTKDIKTRLIAERQDRLKKYASENSTSANNIQKMAEKAYQEKEQYLSGKQGKVEMGIELTPARLQELGDYYDNFSISKADGTIDVARIMRIGILEKNYKLLLQNAYTKGQNDKAILMMKEFARPSREDEAVRIQPDNTSAAQKDVQEFRKELRSN